jgi:hypothetical protein
MTALTMTNGKPVPTFPVEGKARFNAIRLAKRGSGGFYCDFCGSVQPLGSGVIICRRCGSMGLKGFVGAGPVKAKCPVDDRCSARVWFDGVNSSPARLQRIHDDGHKEQP